MMKSDTNAEAPQEWKKRKGFIPTIAGACLFGAAFLSAGKLFTVNNNDDSSANLVRWGVAHPCFQTDKGPCFQKNEGASCSDGKDLVGTCNSRCDCGYEGLNSKGVLTID